MDIIYLNDLRIDTIIGVYDWEHRVKQAVSLDIEIATDINKAAATDNINDALNYKTVADHITAYVSECRCELLETLAENIAGILLNEFNVPWCRIRLNKTGAVKRVREIGVIIERGRRD